MRYRKLGNTGLAVSEIGFGTIPILQGSVPVLPDYYNLNDEEALAVMEHAFGLGCNLYDTAIVPEYGDAERKLGLFAARVGREKLVISDKAPFFDGNEIRRWRHPADIWEPVRISILSIRWMRNMRRKYFKKAVRWMH